MRALHDHIRAVIPARFGSTRLPGKPLADINGKPLIQHVYEEVSEVLTHVVVATDDRRIEEAVRDFGGETFYSETIHVNGTSRTAEAVEALGWKDADFIVNIQGDEAMIEAAAIQHMVLRLGDVEGDIATLISRVADPAVLDESDGAFVALNAQGQAMYFSRYAIPYLQGVDRSEWLTYGTFFKHIGIYAYRPDVLPALATLPEVYAEKAESLEQNRWLAHGYHIHTIESDFKGRSVDTEADLAYVRSALAHRTKSSGI